jgi:putative flippase GtrA
MISRVTHIINKHRETVDYLFFGMLTVAFNTIVFLLLDLVFDELVANTFAFLLSVVFAYCTNTLFVFHQKIGLKTFVQFFGMRIGTIFIDNGGLWLLLSINCDKVIAKCVVNVIIIILNYIFSKFFIYKKECCEYNE